MIYAYDFFAAMEEKGPILVQSEETGATRPYQHPVIKDCTPGQLAELDRRLAHVQREYGGIPIHN
jgi:hypothetical protein